MTEVLDAQTERSSSVARISHWIGGQAVAGESGRSGRVFNPATGDQTGEVDFASIEEIDRAVAAAKAAFPAWRAVSLSKRAELLFRDPRARQPAPRGHRAAPDRRARQGVLRRDGRGRARPRGDRVRVRHPDPAQGRASPSRPRPGSTSTRSASRSASSPASRRSTSRRWCPCGCGRRRSPAATRSC